MKTKIKLFFKENGRYAAASFLLPFLILALVYLSIGIYPGSSRSILASDAFSQFSNFHASFRNMLLGKQSIFYTWNASLGLNYLSLISYYLGGLFTPLVLLFPNEMMPDALYFLTLLKVGCAGLSFWFLARTYKIPRWGQVALSVSYASISFITAHSEIIMWLDAFIYLPLVILGIHRVMDLKRPTLLFVSYLLLFLSSFYMGFMIGVFSFLYFIVRLLTNWTIYKKSILPYGITSLLAGGASMIIILPAVLDLRSNGEALTQITTLKTEATSYLDIIMKNMIGVYDTTKYGSIPFIYAGLFPLVLCLFYFASQKVKIKNKLLFGSLFALLIASFYLVPLNLFWHGMHAPNMFLFRYSYLFSFLVLLLAAKGWEYLTKEDQGLLLGIIIVLAAIFAMAWGLKPNDSYTYITTTSFVLTIVFLGLYALTIGFFQQQKQPLKYLSLLLLLLMTAEASVNTNSMIHGILDDWNYASRSLYTDPSPAIKTLVDQTKQESDSFYRLENLDPISPNDSINYGYSGISLFSSIRNRNSSSYLDSLGFRSRGTNLNIRYANNTLLMDGFTGIKYNIAKNDSSFNKYGFAKESQSGEYTLYKNLNALPLAFTAPLSINKVEQPLTDNLTSQTNLINRLSDLNQRYYTFYTPTLKSQQNVTINKTTTGVTYSENVSNQPKTLTWEVRVPANTQAYLSLFPTNYSQLESSTATITVNGTSRKTQIGISGQYYDLGYYPQDTTVTFTASFYGTKEVSFMEPKVLGLDVVAYQAAMNQIQENGVEMKTSGRTASGTVNASEERMLVTTIPYDAGWTAKIDGKAVKVENFKNAFLMIKVPAGKHTVTFSYLPQGFKIGAILFILCIGLFIAYVWYLKKEPTSTKKYKHS
ncbi:copper ABC transporter permease [Enterococcus villorum]|uniref:Copper ABC transporter permease n=1 Tax=Enterococcus villorum TaxID=112904 RepID=A0A1V8YUU2_9ENTE|nr:YfhO family protein [Enterococcus villorum]OQO69958.1 copper ABC transporter permease [Enterococcus villorum]OQO76410.1 copper ABC transporter permease [Enterococcus villorum]